MLMPSYRAVALTAFLLVSKTLRDSLAAEGRKHAATGYGKPTQLRHLADANAVEPERRGIRKYSGSSPWQFSHKPRRERRLLAQNESDICQGLKASFYNHEDALWNVTDDVQLIGGLQRIFGCASDNDSVLFYLTETSIQLNETIRINKSITITTGPEMEGRDDRSTRETSKKMRFTCPSESQGVFEIRASKVTLANLTIVDCNLRGRASPLMLGRNAEDIRLLDVEFANNTHASMKPSTIAISYPRNVFLHMHDVVFDGNRGGSAIVQLPERTEMKNVRASENSGSRAVFVPPNESNLSMIGVKATRNDIAVLEVTNSQLSMSACTFNQNGDAGGIGGTIVVRDGSSVLIKDSSFTRNRAREGGGLLSEDSDVSFVGSTFIANNASNEGGGCFFRNGVADFVDCTFLSNTAGNDGGAIRSEGTEISCLRCFFGGNSALNAASCLKNDEGRVNITLSDFVNNTAIFGGALRSERAEMHISKCVFRNNVASNTAGVCYSDRNILKFFDSIAEGNTAVYGGFLYAANMQEDSIFQNSIFVNNTASLLGGALAFDDGSLRFRNLTFKANSAPQGGGMYIFSSNAKASELFFEENSASQGGSFLSANSTIRITPRDSAASFGLKAYGNTADNGGGALHLENSRVHVRNAMFINGSGTEGGAIRILGESGEVNISDSLFSSNSAVEPGGSVYARSAKEGRIYLEFRNVSFTDSASHEAGGACYLTSVDSRFTNCNFTSCQSRVGGALYLSERPGKMSRVELINSKFVLNEANEAGGAICGETRLQLRILSSSFTNNTAHNRGGGINSDAVTLFMKHVTLDGNEAPKGGGVSAVNGTVLKMRHSAIRNNRATHEGGGLFMQNIQNALAVNVSFAGNTAEDCGGAARLETSALKGDGLLFDGNGAYEGGGIAANLTSRVLCTRCNLLRDKAGSNGGALHIESGRTQELSAQLESCTFAENKAAFGAGIYFTKTYKSQASCQNPESGACGGIFILDTHFENNTISRQRGTGTDIHSNAAKFIFLYCSKSPLTVSTRKGFISREELFESQTEKNRWMPCISGVHEEEENALSSFVESIELQAPGLEKTKTTPAEYSLAPFVSGKELPPILLTPLDFYNHSNAISMTGSITAAISGSLFRGSFLSSSVTGSSVFSGIRTYHNEPGRHNLTISFPEDDHLENITIWVDVRNCTVGETKKDEGVYCEACDADSYTFSPIEQQCLACPLNANCSGRYILPAKGYWQRSPCHNYTVECLTREACDETAFHDGSTAELETRDQVLYNFTQHLIPTCPLNETSSEEFSRLQCHKGYEGILCGACSAGRGLTSNFKCVECPHWTVLVLLLLITVGWTVLLVGITIRGNEVPPACAGLEVPPKNRDEDKSLRKHQPCRSRHSFATGKGSQGVPESSRAVLSLTASTSDRPLETESPGPSHSRDGSHPSVAEENRRQDEIFRLKNVQLAKWHICEIVKIGVNFLQAIAIAIVIHVDWKNYLVGIFRASDLASGASIEAVSNAIHCLSRGWFSRASAASALVALFSPLLVVLGYVLFYFFRCLRDRATFIGFIKKAMLSFCVILYFNYLNITRQSVMMFFCVKVPDSDFMNGGQFSWYWAQDTSLQCYVKNHYVLVIYGTLFLMLVSIGFPALCGFVLYRHLGLRNQVSQGALHDILGFMYRAYERKYCYWESVIMLRKACLSFVAVFSYRFGGTTQALLASFILVMCLYFHTMLKPYRAEFADLNKFESYSLIVSCTTYLLASFFIRDRLPGWAEVTLSSYIFILIVGFAMRIIFAVFIAAFVFFEAELAVVHLLREDMTTFRTFVLWIAYRVGYIKPPERDSEDGACEMSTIE